MSQPGRPKGRGQRTPVPSPVEEVARAQNINRVMCPVKANEVCLQSLKCLTNSCMPATPDPPQHEFLDDLTALQPDLCVTAAYGNVLPQRFLDIPRCGTLNIHPSLLPLYRGAAPVQRALQVMHMNGSKCCWCTYSCCCDITKP